MNIIRQYIIYTFVKLLKPCNLPSKNYLSDYIKLLLLWRITGIVQVTIRITVWVKIFKQCRYRSVVLILKLVLLGVITITITCIIVSFPFISVKRSRVHNHKSRRMNVFPHSPSKIDTTKYVGPYHYIRDGYFSSSHAMCSLLLLCSVEPSNFTTYILHIYVRPGLPNVSFQLIYCQIPIRSSPSVLTKSTDHLRQSEFSAFVTNVYFKKIRILSCFYCSQNQICISIPIRFCVTSNDLLPKAMQRFIKGINSK